VHAQQIVCPRCGAPVTVDQPANGKGVTCAGCGAAIALVTLPAEPADGASGASKPCPYCRESIRAEARKCRFCGEFLDPALKRERALAAGGTTNAFSDKDSGAQPVDTVEYESHPAMFGNHPFGFMATIVLCVAGVGFVILLVWWLRCKAMTLTVTDRRTILRTGLLSRTSNEVYHRDVRNIQVSQSFFQRMMDVGRVAISSAGQSGIEIDVHGLPEPRRVEAAINRHRLG
jgi:hypothetical protein